MTKPLERPQSLPDASVVAIPNEESQLKFVDLDDIHILSGFNSRNDPQQFTEESLQPLVRSIEKMGVLQPICLRVNDPNNHSGKPYTLVAGERRVRASRLASLTRIPSYIRDLTDQEAQSIMIAENTQREKTSYVTETIKGYQMMENQTGLRGKDLITYLNKIRKFPKNDPHQLADFLDANFNKSKPSQWSSSGDRYKVYSLGADIHKAIEAGRITPSAAALLTKFDEAERIGVLKRAMENADEEGRIIQPADIKKLIPKKEKTGLTVTYKAMWKKLDKLEGEAMEEAKVLLDELEVLTGK